MKDISVQGLGGLPDKKPILDDTIPQPEGATTVPVGQERNDKISDNAGTSDGVAQDMGANFSKQESIPKEGDEYDDKGRIIKKMEVDKDGNQTGAFTEYKYDDAGHIVEKVYTKGQYIHKQEYEYDGDNLIKTTQYQNDGKTLDYVTQLNKDGKEETSFYAKDGVTVSYKSIDEKNDQGKITKTTLLTPDNKLKGYITYDYDSDGREIKNCEYDAKNKLKHSNELIYNSEGKLEKAIATFENGVKNITEYNEDEKPIKEIELKKGIQQFVTTYNYNAKNLLARSVTKYRDGQVVTTNFQYDNKDRLVQENKHTKDKSFEDTEITIHSYTNTDKKAFEKTFRDGNIVFGVVYNYDDKGRTTKITYLSDGGQPREIETYNPETGELTNRRELKVLYGEEYENFLKNKQAFKNNRNKNI